MLHQDLLDFRHPDAGANPKRIDADLDSIPAFEPAGYRTSSSGRVQLFQPNDTMRTVHQRFKHTFGTPWRPSYEKMAKRAAERGYEHFYILDLNDAFGSVSADWIVQHLLGLPQLGTEYTYGECEQEIRNFVERCLIGPSGGLVQGAPASPSLFEEFAWIELDLPIQRWLDQERAINGRRIYDYIRFVDDMVFMSHQPLTQRQRDAIKSVIREAGCCINEKKARGIVLRRNTVILTGVAIRRTRSGVRMFLPRKKLTQLEGLLHYANQGKLVNPRQIEGLMGAFLAVTNPRHLNATELRVVRAYEQYAGRTVLSRGKQSWLCF